MADLPLSTTPGALVPVNGAGPFGASGGPILTRLGHFAAQPAVKRAIPWFLGMAALGGAGLTWAMLGPVPQRVLYTQIDDSERASVVSALDKGGVQYKIDNDTGVMTVNESDLYKARMLVAQNGALAMPDGGGDSLDKLPMGASRAVEDEHLLDNREHELELSIKEIDGVQAVRVHIAQGQPSVFVRDTIAPTASVMLRLADGRQLSEPQVRAIVNLVAGSVPGLTPDAVKVVDQHGRLLTDKASGDDDRLEMQARMEEKLQGQVSSLLIPMLGDGNFTSEIQVNLDMDQVTSARETYDKQGVVRAETSQQSQQSTPGQAAGIPGALSNSPPPQAQPSPGAPKGTPAPAASGAPTPTATETSGSKTYELGREVAVSNQGPGKVKRLSVAVALSAKAMAKYKPQDIDQIKQLVSAAVGADPARGDQVAVFVRSFDPPAPPEKTPFYEAAWFGTVLHYGVPLIGLILVLLLAVRPLVNAWLADRKARTAAAEAMKAEAEAAIAAQRAAEQEQRALEAQRAISGPAADAIEYIEGMKIDAAMIGRQVGIAQQIVAQKPDNAVIALRQMLRPEPEPEG